MYLITNTPTLKVWQELRAASIRIYTIVENNGLWSLYTKDSGFQTENEHGQFMYHNTLERVCLYLGVSAPPEKGVDNEQ